MTREERAKRQTHNWLRRTGFSFGNARAGGARIPESAFAEMRRKPYASILESGKEGDDE